MLGLSASRIFTGQRWYDDRVLLIDPPVVMDIIDIGIAKAIKGLEIVKLPADVVLAPGFIDIQVNGGGGVLLNDTPTLEGIRAIAAAHARFGTTGLLPTLITDTADKMDALLAIAPEAVKIPGVLGFHLEGPFLNPERKGVHRADLIRRLERRDIDRLKRFAKVCKTLVTLAPECVETPDLIELADAGVVICAGHSNATYHQMIDASATGVRGVTHLFNAMSQIGPRDGGVVGAALGDSELYASIIADLQHVSASNLELALKLKTRDKLMLVTDAMPTAASDVTTFNLQGRTITLADDKLTDETSTLAGAHLTMSEAVTLFMAATGCDLHHALVCASRTPATFLGLEKSNGRLDGGSRADVVAFDPDTGAVTQTWIGGKPMLTPPA